MRVGVENTRSAAHTEHSFVQPRSSQGLSRRWIQQRPFLGFGISAVALHLECKEQFLMDRQEHAFAPLHRQAIDFVSLPVDFFPPETDGIGTAQSGPTEQ
jgi:hypothetical protein